MTDPKAGLSPHRRPVGIRIDNCTDVVLEGNQFIGDMDPIVATNSSGIRARDNVAIASHSPAVVPPLVPGGAVGGDSLPALLYELRAWSRRAQLGEGAAEIQEALAVAKQESNTSRPNSNALRRCFETILPVLQNAAGDIIAQGLGVKIIEWLSRLK